MGIKGLNTFLQRQVASLIPLQTIEPGSIFLVDGTAFAFAVLDRLGAGAKCFDADYSKYDALLDSIISTIVGSWGCELRVYSDGPITRMKQATKASRRAQREHEWDNVQLYCCDGSTGDPVPAPALFLQQFYTVLQRLGIQVVRCEEEADQQLAIDCAELGERCFVLGCDSDFFLFRGMRYIRLPDMRFTDPSATAASPPCTVRVWTREATADSLDLTEARLVDLALLFGNDFTAGHSLADFDLDALPADRGLPADASLERKLRWLQVACPRAPPHRAPRTVTVTDDNTNRSRARTPPPLPSQEAALEGEPPLLARASSPSLQLAVRFVRALYDCGDITGFPADAPAPSGGAAGSWEQRQQAQQQAQEDDSEAAPEHHEDVYSLEGQVAATRGTRARTHARTHALARKH
jgi:hypothetical protein